MKGGVAMFEFMYDLATYGNVAWKGHLSPKEIASRAYIYTCDCQASTREQPRGSMVELLDLLEDDIYAGSEEARELFAKLMDWLDK